MRGSKSGKGSGEGSRFTTGDSGYNPPSVRTMPPGKERPSPPPPSDTQKDSAYRPPKPPPTPPRPPGKR